MALPNRTLFYDKSIYVVRIETKNKSRRSKRRQESNEGYKDCSTNMHDILVEPREFIPKKSVSFSALSGKKYIKHISQFTKEQYEATWYTESDLQGVFDDCVANLKKMVHGKVILEEHGFCARGLEFKTPAGAKFRKCSKAQAMSTFMDEYMHQNSTGIEDQQYLADLYIRITENSKRLAHLTALRDQEDVRPLVQTKSSVKPVTREDATKNITIFDFSRF